MTREVLVQMTVAWLCPACEHHNPGWRMACRRCRTARPFGSGS